MNKHEKRLAALFALLFIVYNVVLFVIAGFKDNTSAFWVSYVFAVISFVASGATLAYNFSKGLNIRDYFFGYPVIKWSLVYLGVQIAVSSIIMLFKDCSVKVPVIFGILWLAAFIIIIFPCFSAKEFAEEVEKRTVAKTSNMRNLYTEISSLVSRAGENDREMIEKLAEKFRYSDPVSDSEIDAIENEIKDKLAVLKDNISFGTEIASVCKEIDVLLDERNLKCKLNKKVR